MSRHIHEQLAELRESLFNSPLNVLWSETPFSVKIQIKKSLIKLNRPEQAVPNNPIIGCSPNSLARCDKCEHMSIAFRQAQQESRMIIETLEAARMEATERINVLAGNLAATESEKLRIAEEAEMAREELISQLEHLKSELSQANSKLSAIGNERKNDLERTDSAKKDFEKNLEQIKSELSQRNLQLKAKNKSLNDHQIQSNQVVAEHERARSELTKKVDNLLRKNSNLQSLLDESKKKLKEERASHKKKRKGKDKAIQVDMTVTAKSDLPVTAATDPAMADTTTAPAATVVAATATAKTAGDSASTAIAIDPKYDPNDDIVPTVPKPPATIVNETVCEPLSAAAVPAAPDAAADASVEETTKDSAETAEVTAPAWARHLLDLADKIESFSLKVSKSNESTQKLHSKIAHVPPAADDTVPAATFPAVLTAKETAEGTADAADRSSDNDYEDGTEDDDL